MSKRGRERKQKHVNAIRAKREERSKNDKNVPAAPEKRKRIPGREVMSLTPRWQRNILESIKKREKKSGTRNPFQK